MPETVFDELKRYTRFASEDEACLRAFQPVATPHFAAIVDAFYERVAEHPQARRVFSGGDQIARHKLALRDWLELLLAGPWDAAYFERRARIGHVHVQIGLAQRFMFGAMSLIRTSLLEIAPDLPTHRALHKLLDLELAIMLESYREAYIERVQQMERLERDDLQRRLALSEARYEEIVEKAEALVTTIDRDGRVLLFNSKCERSTGIARDAARGRSWLSLFVPEPDRPSVRERWERALAGLPAASYEGAVPVIDTGRMRVRWHFTTLPDGHEPALCAIGIDVSQEHELGVRTRRAERLAALGTMAAGLAHEIRNPLNAAHLQLSVAERRLQRSEPDLQGAQTAVRAANAEMQRLGSLVQDFLQFARPHALRLARVDLRQTVEASLVLLEPEAQSRGVDLQLVAGEAAPVDVDEEKLRQVLLNLVRNALDATGAGGHVELSTALGGSDVLLTVRDDGPGIPDDAPIFEPFYTTKEDGTGLGLAIVHRIIMDHGGQVAVQSVPGDTRVIVSLPRPAGR